MFNVLATEGFGGNKKLKKAGVNIEWTPEMVEEYLRCARDPIYFIRTYVKIVNVDRGLVQFEMWPFQEKMVKAFVDHRFVIAKIARQQGKTSTAAATVLWYLLFNADFSSAILAHKEKQAREILRRLKGMYEELPLWLQVGITEWNKSTIILANGSRVMAASTSATAIRGESQNLLILDEFAFVPKHIQEDFFGSVYPTISSGKTTKVIITSTPNGMNLFYKVWAEADHALPPDKRNSYFRVEAHWSDVPGRDENWKKQTIQNTSERQFRQEFECEFLGSTNTLISPDVLARLAHVNPVEHTNTTDVWHPPEKDHVYLITVDTSRGLGLDSSVALVFDITTIPYTIAAKYRSDKIPALMFPSIIYNLAKSYNDAWVLVETNDVGSQVADILHFDLEYEGMLWSQTAKSLGTKKVADGFGTSPRLGVNTNKAMKRVGCVNLKSLIEDNRLIISDYDLIYELFRFVERNGTFAAEEGEHDDLVMCCVLFAWQVNQPAFRDLTQTNARLSVIEANRQSVEEDMAPFGFIVDGSEDPTEADPNDDNWMYVDRLPEQAYPIVSDRYKRKN